VRDPAKFPHFIHTQKRDPATHLGGDDDSTMFWDYLSQNPESIHQVMILMGDRGIPAGYRHMHGYYGHTLKVVKQDGSWLYAQFHLISDQGTKNFTTDEAAAESNDYGGKDLYNAIERGEYPSWTMQIQTMTQEQAEQAWAEKRINVFDLTHIWPHKDYPLRTIGKLTLHENPANYFAEVEQVAYNPAHMVPGIEPSADPVLQSRLFSYPDAHRHRIGANYQQLPVNQPVCPFRMGNFQRDGQMAFFNQGSRPNYLSSIEPISFKERKYDLNKVHGKFVGEAVSFLSEIHPEDFNAPSESTHPLTSSVKRLGTLLTNCSREALGRRLQRRVESASRRDCIRPHGELQRQVDHRSTDHHLPTRLARPRLPPREGHRREGW